MLQIATGKLFTRAASRTNRLRGVLYTNARFGFDERRIETAAGALLSTTPENGVHPVIFEMDEQIESHESGNDFLISHTMGPYLDDFAIVATFGLQVLVSPDRDLVRDLTPSRGEGELGLSRYVARVFDPFVAVLEEDIRDFEIFVGQLIGLERRRFLAAMRAMRTYVSALHRLPDNPTMAYALMVSAVEALAQDFDAFEPSWAELDPRKRTAVDDALKDVPDSVADAVRAAIVSTEHMALGRRYRAFVTGHVDGAYFRSAPADGRPVNRYELQPALRNAYRFRSEYLHTLQRLPDDIGEPYGVWETAMVDREAALTLRGLSRLTRHVIRRFVEDGAVVATEPYDYVMETSGVRMAHMAAEYWVWHPLETSGKARQKLEGLLEQYAAVLTREPGAKITDLRSVLADVERLMPQAPEVDRPAMLALHYLFNSIVPDDIETPGCEAFLAAWEAAAEAPCPETFIARTLFDNAQTWDTMTFRKAHDLYFQQRTRPGGLHAPRILEAAAILAFTERVRAEGEPGEARHLAASAVEIFPESFALRVFEANLDLDAPIDWRAVLLPPERQKSPGD